MSITIGFDFKEKKIIKNETITGNEYECKILNNIIEKLQELCTSNFTINSSTSDYLTLKYKECDICRVKYTNKTKWISVLMLSKEDRKENENNALFDLQKNKNQLHWKSVLNNENIDMYVKYLKNSCMQIDKNN